MFVCRCKKLLSVIVKLFFFFFKWSLHQIFTFFFLHLLLGMIKKKDLIWSISEIIFRAFLCLRHGAVKILSSSNSLSAWLWETTYVQRWSVCLICLSAWWHHSTRSSRRWAVGSCFFCFFFPVNPDPVGSFVVGPSPVLRPFWFGLSGRTLSSAV